VLIYSDYKGDKEINNITERIRAAFTDTDYDLGPSLKVITQSLDLVKVERVEEYRQGTINIKLKYTRKIVLSKTLDLVSGCIYDFSCRPKVVYTSLDLSLKS